MSVLLEDRNKRQRGREDVSVSISRREGQKSLNSLVESVKRKSHAIEEKRIGSGKRRKQALK